MSTVQIRSKKRKQTPQGVPNNGDPDRKRVLNVLAQQRYRQKQKRRLAELEARAIELAPSPTASLNAPLDDITFTPVEPESSKVISSPGLEGNATVDIEDILRSTTEIAFPFLDYGTDLSHKFSTQAPPANTPNTELHPDFPTAFLLPPDPSTPSSPPPPHCTSPPIAFPLTPDPTNLTIPNLSTFRAFATIASAIGVISNFHNPNYLHTLSPTPAPNLPPNLHPTSAQITIPHHPLLDILPWPSVREKLICILALPSELRPLIAREEGDEDGSGQAKAVVQIVHDLDDMADGCRIHGNLVAWGEGSEFAEESWEMGECFFKNWWWCIDGRVVNMSNLRRRQRGLGCLRIAA
ncbi:Ff.00g011970.m01.CDS01 [Fusarium sp. VM40]|nr:Ff.00g011970.m01.CDS01 [Fusarium sp. VM40]